MTFHLDNKKIEKVHGLGQAGGFILLMWGFSERSVFTKGIRAWFLLLNASAVNTRRYKKIPVAHQLPLVYPEVGFKRASCGKAKQSILIFM